MIRNDVQKKVGIKDMLDLSLSNDKHKKGKTNHEIICHANSCNFLKMFNSFVIIAL